jgi:hypothetical protein
MGIRCKYPNDSSDPEGILTQSLDRPAYGAFERGALHVEILLIRGHSGMADFHA